MCSSQKDVSGNIPKLIGEADTYQPPSVDSVLCVALFVCCAHIVHRIMALLLKSILKESKS